MKSLLNEHFRHLLNEEIDYSTNTATVYHLTGFKTSDYNPAWANITKNTNDKISKEIDKKHNKKTRASSVLANIEYEATVKDQEKYKDSKGQAYFLAKAFLSDPYQKGTGFTSGYGAAYGEGLYTCYNLNPAIARTYGNVILRLEVDISNFLIFNAGIAKKIHGPNNFLLEDQFDKIIETKRLEFNQHNEDQLSGELRLSPLAESNFDEFKKDLAQRSKSPAFLNSDINTQLRTAGDARSALFNFSILFDNGRILKLRDIIDGVIFFGSNDGPVCVVYHPETLKTYGLTGAGYFDENKNAVITSDIESLVGGYKGIDLKDVFDTAKEVDDDNEAYYKKTSNFLNILSSATPGEIEDSFLSDFPEMVNKVTHQLDELIDVEEIVSKRFESTPDLNNFVSSLSEAFKFLQLAPSVITEPFFDFIDIYGPGTDIISKEEFEKYCYLLKEYLISKESPKLSDFESNSLKCIAQTQEELDEITRTSYDIISSKYKSIIENNLVKELINLQRAIDWGDELACNNNLARFSFDFLDLNISHDGDIVSLSLDRSGAKFKDITEKLKELFSDDRLKTDNGQKMLEEIFQWGNLAIDKSGRLNLNMITKNVGWYSVCLSAGADLQYSLIDSIDSIDFAGLNTYKVDKDKFTPAFVLTKLYDIEESHLTLDLSANIISMFKNGDKLYKTSDILDKENVKQQLLKEKTDNLYVALEDVYKLLPPRSRPSTLI